MTTNNDVLRSLRYALELDNPTLLGIFAEGDAAISPRYLAALLKSESEDGFEPLQDDLLARVLDGLITRYRGKREPSAPQRPGPALPLSNNAILRALRIALELKDADLLGILSLAGVTISKPELSALFRREDHRNYQPCGDQFLRSFMRGLGIWHRQGRPRV